MFKHILFLFLLLLGQAPALAEYFVIDRFDIEVRIDQSGFFEVTETIDVTFSEPRHGIYRVIPYRYRIGGKKYKIGISEIQVEGRKFKREYENGNLRIRIGDPDAYVEAQQRYILRYKVKRAWLFEENHTEFYWNLTGNDWEVPIEYVTFRIQLPEGVNLGRSDYRLFTGYAGEQGDDAEADWENGLLSGHSTQPYAPGEGVTVAIRLPPTLIERPSEVESFLQNYGLAGIPAALLGLLGWLFFRFGRDEPFVKMVQYYPPEGLPPAEAGVFIDDKADRQDVVALLPYWGGLGYLTIREVKEEKLFGLFSSPDFEFQKKEALPDGLPDYEYTVFNRLFRDGDTVRLSDLKNEFYKTMSSAQNEIERAVRQRQLHTPHSRMIWGMMPAAAIISAILALGFIWLDQPAAAGGMFLAALATFIGRGTGVLYQLYILFGKSGIVQLRWEHFKVHLRVIRKLAKVASTGAGQFLIGSASWIFLMRIIAHFGSEAVAGYTIAIRLIIFTILPSWGLANAAATLVGQNLGAGQPERAEQSVWKSAFYNMLFLLSVSIIYFLFATPILGLFNNEPAVLEAGVLSLRIICTGYIFFAYGMVISQAFNGAGDTRTPTLINLFCFWMLEIPLAYFLAISMEWGLAGVCWSIAGSEAVLAIISILVFRMGYWKTVDI